jgi:hypothetical protein
VVRPDRYFQFTGALRQLYSPSQVGQGTFRGSIGEHPQRRQRIGLNFDGAQAIGHFKGLPAEWLGLFCHAVEEVGATGFVHKHGHSHTFGRTAHHLEALQANPKTLSAVATMPGSTPGAGEETGNSIDVPRSPEELDAVTPRPDGLAVPTLPE